MSSIRFQDGTEYTVEALNDEDMDNISKWIRSVLLRRTREMLREQEDMSEAERTNLLQVTISRLSSITWMSPDGVQTLATVEGMARMVWMGARKAHEGLTYEQVLESMNAGGNKALIARNVESANDTMSIAMPKRFRSGRSQAQPTKKEKRRQPKNRRKRRRRDTKK